MTIATKMTPKMPLKTKLGTQTLEDQPTVGKGGSGLKVGMSGAAVVVVFEVQDQTGQSTSR